MIKQHRIHWRTYDSCIVSCILLLLFGCSSTDRLAPTLAAIDLHAVPLTYSHRRVETTFCVSADDWQEITELFAPPPPSPREERLGIRRAVALLEQIAGFQHPTYRDWRMDDINPAGIGCMDCIDEAVNTTTYLRLLEERGLLRFHEVMQKAFRGPFQLDTHYAGQIRQRDTGDLYVVDSWFLANGWPPYVQKTSEWIAKQPWPAAENPETFDEAALDVSRAYRPHTD
jgi:hypothetical protein